MWACLGSSMRQAWWLRCLLVPLEFLSDERAGAGRFLGPPFQGAMGAVLLGEQDVCSAGEITVDAQAK